MNYSDTGIKLTTDFEGNKLEAYLDGGGVWTIGRGHTKDVKKGDKITEAQSLSLFLEDVKEAMDAVNKLVRLPLTQGQFDALVDFVFNLGEAAFSRSTLLKYLNEGNFEAAVYEFQKWNHDNGKVVAGLTRRRKAEADLFGAA